MCPNYTDALKRMDGTLYILESEVPAPKKIASPNSYNFRYVEKTIHQAIVQKLARSISGIRATILLAEAGYIQEQASLQRTLDEIHEDITFLSYGAIFDDITELHSEFLSAFYEEEFDADTALESTQKRPMISRKKIRAYLARTDGQGNPSRGIELHRTIQKVYSGYVHAASPQIMDMYGGTPARFHTSGLVGTSRQSEHLEDLWNYVYRGILAAAFAAKALGQELVFDQLRSFAKEFALESGREYV